MTKNKSSINWYFLLAGILILYFGFSNGQFQNQSEMYTMRIKVISIFIGIMLLINGLKLIPTKLNYWIVFIFVGVIVLMRILRIGLY